ncbi:MAG: 2-hydroxychromene-2-carboxylate isomerase [Hyphomicrobiales bacterium]
MRPVIEFWFDFASTYSYLTAMRIEEIATPFDVDVRWKPFLLGPLFAKQGWTDSPFNIYPAKGRYMVQDMQRLCAARGLPFKMPPSFPARSITVNRLGLVALDEAWGVDFAKAVFNAQFGEGLDIGDDMVLRALLTDLGQDANDVFERALSIENKERLKNQTSEAESKGIFGAPSFVTERDELFWGDDRLINAIKSDT